MKIKVPLEVELSDQEVRKIVQNFLREKYGFLSTYQGEKILKNDMIVEHRFDPRGAIISTKTRPASAMEKAAGLIIDSLS